MLECVWCLAGGWYPSDSEECSGRQMLFGNTMNDTLLSLWCQCWQCYDKSVYLNYEWMCFQENGSELWEDGEKVMWNVQAASAFFIADIKSGIYYLLYVCVGGYFPFPGKIWEEDKNVLTNTTQVWPIYLVVQQAKYSTLISLKDEFCHLVQMHKHLKAMAKICINRLIHLIRKVRYHTC